MSLYSPAVEGGGALEAVLILGRLDGANLENHLDFPLGASSSLSEVFLSIGDVVSEVNPSLVPALLSSYVSEAMCWCCCSSRSSSMSPTSLNIDCRPFRILLTMGRFGSLELSLSRSDVTSELNLGRVTTAS